MTPVIAHQAENYTQDLQYNITKDWVFHNTPSGYMDRDGWMKAMMYLKTVCGEKNLNTQVLLHDGHDSHFYARSIHIIRSHHIKPFILKADDSGNDQPNDNGRNLKLKGLYGQPRMNWFGTTWNPQVKKLPHKCCTRGNMDIFLDLLSPYNQQYLQENKSFTPPPTLWRDQHPSLSFSIPNYQDKKSEEIEVIANTRIFPEDVVVIRTTDPMNILRNKVNVGSSRKLLLREAAYNIISHRTVLTLQQIKETEMEIRTRRMVMMPNKDGEGETRRMNLDYLEGIYVTASL